MNSTPACHPAATRLSLPSPGDGIELSDRQAAVLYLHAARLTDDPEIRAMLRRRGGQLLCGRLGTFRGPRAC